jgi:hypothetical protein
LEREEMKKIVIYDDMPQFKGRVKALIEKPVDALDAFEVVRPLDDEELKYCLKVLESRRRGFRKTGTWSGERTFLDEASIFVIDFDLFDVFPYVEGDDLAYLARCFSDCGLIIGYRYADESFDLTLRGELRSFTDLYVGGTQLGNPGLWGEAELTETGFRPWYWPILPDYLRRFEKKMEDVEKSLAEDMPICRVLGFPPDSFSMLPRSLSEFLGKEPDRITFRRLVTSAGSGLEPKDAEGPEAADDHIVARIGAARISKWLEWSVLPEQDIVVDAPHLVQRFPSLLAGEVGNVQSWNETLKLANHEELGMKVDLIEPFRFEKEHWFSRPVWFWDGLRECEEIVEVREPWKFEKTDWVFCEDTSRFHDREECREFVADVESPYARRFVRELDDVEYRPRVRFSL